MNLTVTPGNPLQGQVTVPGDKSISHRAALLAALAESDSVIHNFLSAGVTGVMLEALRELGVSFEIDRSTLIVHGRGPNVIKAPDHPINCGNSATTMRLLAGFLAALGIPAILDGTPGLRKRPMARIVEPLQAMGVPIQASETCTAPLVLRQRPKGQKLLALDYTMPVASAQVKSTLLLAALAADGTCKIHEPGPSRDHSELLMESLGIEVSTEQSDSEDQRVYRTISLTPPGSLTLPNISMTVPGDISSAAFLIVGATITKGSDIQILHTGINPTRTGLIDALHHMGANITLSGERCHNGEPTGEINVSYSQLNGTQINGPLVVRMIDEFPAFTTAAVFAKGETQVSDAEELRHKESDRITALVGEFQKLGAHINENLDGYMIAGGEGIDGGLVQPHGDHRLAMSLAIAGLVARDPVTIRGAEIISESFPGFIETLKHLGANVSTEVTLNESS
jgi:3-phosphoshikimate 1-carboxyvinyltransferase